MGLVLSSVSCLCCCVDLAVACSVHEGQSWELRECSCMSWTSTARCSFVLFRYLGSMLALYCRMCSVVCHRPLGRLLLQHVKFRCLTVQQSRCAEREAGYPRRQTTPKVRGQPATKPGSPHVAKPLQPIFCLGGNCRPAASHTWTNWIAVHRIS